MTIDQYVATISGGKRLSAVKRLILNILWRKGEEFPSAWVRSSYILEQTKQKYFDRRARELRDENGCDIETRQIDGEHQWRILSTNVLTQNTRAYLTQTQKENLFEISKYVCAVCGKEALPGVRGLQADHKIPLIRGGTNETENWQSLCNECNVAKRRACAGCYETCRTCFWAFPEKKGLPITVYLNREEFDRVSEILKNDQNWLKTIIKNSSR